MLENEDGDVYNIHNGYLSREELLNDRKEREVEIMWVERQKTFIWVRVFLSEDDNTLTKGDIVNIQYTPNGETLEAIFGSYNKKNSTTNKEINVEEYDPEDDRKILCLAVDIDYVNDKDNDIPFIRTLFKQGKFHEDHLLKRNELKIYTSTKNFEYHTVDF